MPTTKNTLHLADTPPNQLNDDHLIAANLEALTSTLGKLTATVTMLTGKIESIASHVVATEEILSQVTVTTGLDLAKVNTRIRGRVESGTSSVDLSRSVVDAAAAIVSPPC